MMAVDDRSSEEKVFSKETVDKLKPAPVYPIPFPCRIDESSRTIHCDSCEIVPELKAEIASLKEKLKERQKKDES